MKKLIKLLVNVLAMAMVLVASLSLFACSDKTVTIQLNLAIYDVSDNAYYEDTTLTVVLEREYAPETVDAIVSYIEEGYYNDTIFYGTESSMIMVGDLKMTASGEIVQNAVKPKLAPEFANNGGVTGSELTVKEGVIGLWRTWPTGQSFTVSSGNNTGRATWFIPTADISSYNDNFALFATIDLDDETNAETIANLKSAVVDNAEAYQVYYTGEYSDDDSVLNNGLTFNCEEDVPDNVTVFKPKGEQYDCYKQHQIKIAKGAGNYAGARIVSIEII